MIDADSRQRSHRLGWIICLLLAALSLIACTDSPPASTTTEIDPPGSIPLPATPLFVLTATESSILVIDTATHAIVKTIKHPDLVAARDFAVTPEGLLYVALDYTRSRAYNRIMVIDPVSGAIVASVETAVAPQLPRWIGGDTVMVGHGTVSKTGHDLVTINTRDQSIGQRLKRPELLVDAVAVGDVVYMLENAPPFLMAYDRTTQTVSQAFALPWYASNIVLADAQHVYLSINGRPDPTMPCGLTAATLARLSLVTGKLDVLGTPRYVLPYGLAPAPNNGLLALDSCFDPDHGSITLFDGVTGAVRAQTIFDDDVNTGAMLSQVTPQGEIAVYREEGRLHWYDAATLAARGETALPSLVVLSMQLYPTESKVRK